MVEILNQYIDDNCALYNADACEAIRMFEDNSMDLSVFSPPFSSLYTYSNSDRDLGNSRTDEEFLQHFSFIIEELFRIMKPGRIVGIHCMNLPTSKERDGFIGHVRSFDPSFTNRILLLELIFLSSASCRSFFRNIGAVMGSTASSL